MISGVLETLYFTLELVINVVSPVGLLVFTYHHLYNCFKSYVIYINYTTLKCGITTTYIRALIVLGCADIHIYIYM